MEPWLDSLSEDWNSEPHLSSPASSLSSTKKSSTQSLRASQTKIPHLSRSLREDSTSSFLKPRSSRGIAKVNGASVLSERSASSLNVAKSPRNESLKSRTSNIPRRTSSAFSESQSSVQHHEVDNTSRAQDVPDWKRRLADGEEAVNDGVDLFSPSKLEGIFAEPVTKKEGPARHYTQREGGAKPWGSLKLGQFSSTSEQYQSLRASRTRAPLLEALYEVNEEEQEQQHQEIEQMEQESCNADEQSADSWGVTRRDSMDESVHVNTSYALQSMGTVANHSRTVSSSRDPRWRTISGQQEIMNEIISPVTVSAKNTIRDRAVQKSVDLNSESLKQILNGLSDGRPSSRSSDNGISYLSGQFDQEPVREMPPELTSHSLPEDLSMGTQDFVSSGNHIKNRGSRAMNDSSVTQSKISSRSRSEYYGQEDSQILRSSPPMYKHDRYPSGMADDTSASLPEMPSDTSVVRHSPSPIRPSSTGSPLKLFGNRDTYTNNKLMRILSHYGNDDSTLEPAEISEQKDPDGDSRNEFRMSRFGIGELDSFNFDKEVKRPRASSLPHASGSTKVFGQLDYSNDIAKSRAASLQRNALPRKDDNSKRIPSSPAKDRTPKRRRTLLKDEIFVQGVGVEIKLEQLPDASTAVAGKKRKDARPGEHGEQADANVLAARNILRPKSGSRKSSLHDDVAGHVESETPVARTPPAALTEALAAELASFAKGVSEAHHDSRKPSLATRDYMEEANKVMEFIRARGKPGPKQSGILEHSEIPELGSDDILDLELDDDSTKESFSRPPSRERPVRPREDRRVAKHDPSVASQLKKYQELDDFELLASTSVIGTLNVIDHQVALEAARIPIPDEHQVSSPPNIRILNLQDSGNNERDGSDSGTQAEQHPAEESTRRTFATNSSSSSGQKGVISSGTVSIPENIGTMTFDRERQIWIKQKLNKHFTSHAEADHTQQSVRETTMDEDPFHGIPDLSIDEEREVALRTTSNPSAAAAQHCVSPEELSAVNLPQRTPASQPSDHVHNHSHPRIAAQQSKGMEGTRSEQPNITEYMGFTGGTEKQYAISEHEERLRKGLHSTEPDMAELKNRQPRAVTIAFSSPVVSHVQHPNDSVETDAESDNDDDFLPPDDSDYEDYVPTPQQSAGAQQMDVPGKLLTVSSYYAPKASLETSTIVRRPVSPIIELDEDSIGDEGMSLVHVNQGSEITTPRLRRNKHAGRNASAYKGSSILCLTPLSEFTMHKADHANVDEESFIVARPHPKALIQAHGALALSKDEMIKAITDASPNEPFWERLHQLDLADSRLESLNALQDYCPALEELILRKNNISQLTGLPSSLRRIDAGLNYINDFTSWLHLQNLQHVDVSGNRLESLEAFSSLIHLRDLKASGNNIKSMDGVLGLDGLISLDVSGNAITEVNFKGGNLSQLKSLDLDNNKLTSIHNLECVPSLERLQLSKNCIKEISAKSMIRKIRHISLADNELETLDLACFPNIESLDVDNNAIRSLQGLSNSAKLRILSARAQKHSFDLVNVILGTRNECSELYLSMNLLEGGQIVLPQYPHYNLRVLELAGCGLRTFPQGFGDYFPNCRNLNLNYNAVSDLSQMAGCIKIEEILLAGNRIHRLRRTCLALARLPFLTTLDIRENPLTVGFYSPINLAVESKQNLTMPDRCTKSDAKWRQVLDEETAMKRRMFELLLTEKCNNLKSFNGSCFERDQTWKLDSMWTTLMSKGVLAKPTEAVVEEIVLPELSGACSMEHRTLRIVSNSSTMNDDTRSVLRERSLVIE